MPTEGDCILLPGTPPGRFPARYEIVGVLPPLLGAPVLPFREQLGHGLAETLEESTAGNR